MLYTEESRIGALAVHIVGNKAKDEPLMVSPSLSDQLSDAALMQTLAQIRQMLPSTSQFIRYCANCTLFNNTVFPAILAPVITVVPFSNFKSTA